MEIPKRKIIILDTTLRDGDQAPGMAFSTDEKIRIAILLEKLGVDIIEAGFPASSKAEYDAVREIASEIKNSAVSALARALPGDIEAAGMALSGASKKYIHITIPTSPVHREYKIKKSREDILKMAVESVAFARKFADVVEMGAEDAARTEYKFLAEFCVAAAEAGADIVNITDTVGYAQPAEFSRLIKNLMKDVPAFAAGSSLISVHCHNDLGLALANTLAGIMAGAAQAECTLLGIGERAGNAALEELVAAISAREDYYRNLYTGVRPEYFADAARAVFSAAGMGPYPNKPVLGAHTHSHSSGIHQHGMSGNSRTYSILKPQRSSAPSMDFVMSRHSGHTGLKEKIKELSGLELSDENIGELFTEFKNIAKRKKIVTATDILLLLCRQGYIKNSIWILKNIHYLNGQSQNKGEFSVFMEFINQNNAVKCISRNGISGWDAVISALKSVFHFDIKIIGFHSSLYGDESVRSERFCMEAGFEGNVYRDECCGSDILIMFVESYLNIVNKITTRFQFVGND